MVELRAAGQSWRDIAASLGVSVATAIRPIKPLVFGNLCHVQPLPMTQSNELLLLDNAFENHMVLKQARK